MSFDAAARPDAARRPSRVLTFGRRSALVAASSGLALTIAAPAAFAAPGTPAQPRVDVDALAQQGRVPVAVSPTVVVPADAQWSIDLPDVVATLPPPPPPPPAPVVEEEEPAAARTSPTPTRSEARSPSAAPSTAVPQNYSGNAVVEIAYRYIGTPYVYGGSTPAGFDCSGFTQYVFRQVGISLPRSSAAQRNAGRVVSAAEARAGDLVWWSGHVGIYLGDGMHIAARNPGTPLHVSPLYRANPTFIRVG